MKLPLLILGVFFLQACRHPLAIQGQGDIVERLIGHRGCRDRLCGEFRGHATRWLALPFLLGRMRESARTKNIIKIVALMGLLVQWANATVMHGDW